MLSLQGNTAVYLLYAHARICSIERKSGKDIQVGWTGPSHPTRFPDTASAPCFLPPFPGGCLLNLTNL